MSYAYKNLSLLIKINFKWYIIFTYIHRPIYLLILVHFAACGLKHVQNIYTICSADETNGYRGF